MVSRGEFMRRAHVLKSWPAFFQAILDGDKNFEVRYDDRHYQRGDVVLLREFNPAPDADETNRYTGREVQAVIGWVQHGTEWGLADGFCAFSLVGLITPEQLQAAQEQQLAEMGVVPGNGEAKTQESIADETVHPTEDDEEVLAAPEGDEGGSS